MAERGAKKVSPEEKKCLFSPKFREKQALKRQERHFRISIGPFAAAAQIFFAPRKAKNAKNKAVFKTDLPEILVFLCPSVRGVLGLGSKLIGRLAVTEF